MGDPLYRPINTPKPVCPNLWIVDGPTIRFGFPWPKLPFPTRMTLLRIGGDLFVHSPTSLTGELRSAVEAIGRPRWVVAPNRIHYWWLPDWHAAFADAEVYLAPRVREQDRHGRIDFETRSLDRPDGYPWDDTLATLPVAGSFMTEVVFFHCASRTLILADLIENFEAAKADGRFMRILLRIGGVLDPDGQMPRDLRLTFRGKKAELRAAVRTMLGWTPERIILAQGRWYRQDGTAELRRAFRWLLD